MHAVHRHALVAAVVGLALTTASCATIPADSYGVDRLRVEGMEDLDPAALRACLATRERKRFGVETEETCGTPPFDGSSPRVLLWPWPWSDWPVYDLSVFERDLQRIERWYRARGYYEARVVSAEFDPPVAANSDRVPVPEDGEEDLAPCTRVDDDEGCRVEITVRVHEGEPILVRSVNIEGLEELDATTADEVWNAPELVLDGHWDEILYDRGKAKIDEVLHEQGYACAEVEGQVNVDPEAKSADVRYMIRPGPVARIGTVAIDGHEGFPEETIRVTADLETGDPYKGSEILNAQRAVYGLGAFASVTIETTPIRDAGGTCTGVVDVTVRVEAGKQFRFGMGAGLQSGTITSSSGTGDSFSVQRWDTHLVFFAEHRNLFGGLRRLRIEDRPKVVFQDRFPRAVQPAPGNELRVFFRQPSFLEARTSLTVTGQWDIGPDLTQGLCRHIVDTATGLSRNFLDGQLLLSAGFHANMLFRPSPEGRGLCARANRDINVTSGLIPPPINQEPIADYHVLFFEQYVQLDLRDDSLRPTRGFFFAMGAQQAGFFLPSDFDYVRLTPEVRAYAPLPAGIVFAARLGIGAMMRLRHEGSLDAPSEILGPQPYRIRSGGPSNHRGFLAGALGDPHELAVPGDLTRGVLQPFDGGLRRWEASLELRFPLSEDFGLVTFADFGDVTRSSRFRAFESGSTNTNGFYLRPAVGLGLRYQTIVGPLRFDVGWLVNGAQVIGGPEPPPMTKIDFGFVKFPGAIHLTIGEAF